MTDEESKYNEECKADCSIENLEWVSREENAIREHKNKLAKRDVHTDYLNWKKSSKVTPETRFKIMDMYKEGTKTTDLSELFNLSQSQISVIVRNEKSTSTNKELFENAWYWERLLSTLNELREKYLKTKDMVYFRLLRQLLPMGYNYTSMFDCDYATLRNIYCWRVKIPHKLTEWKQFGDWVESLPYAEDLIIN